ncbi:MAG: Methanogenesis regulatory protein FilR1 [Candidatus Argoarchaeum ethanivorans]|uniref:Methanogenesis regulatory protein FilR1 n=1 Tax=Candidatus Argoarchaeum ethanivorans TaxID=2608793 RepID=A0A811TBY2_9EURY|nr:MAG: Methanogenesis regulatory protein FilR1 [Candidatus Argoarchaeum ethanivorans]
MTMIDISTTNEHINIVEQHASLISMPYKKTKPTAFQTTIRLSTCSQLRSDILISLKSGRKELRNFRTDLGVSSTTAIHALRELEKDNLIFQDEDRNYVLTKIGEVVALKLADFIDAIEVMKTHEDFWLTHDLSGIPEHLIEKIGALRGSTLFEDTATEIFKVHTNFINLLMNAKKIRGVSSIFVPEYPALFEKLILKKEADVELVITKEVLKTIDDEILKKIFADKSSKLKLYVTEKDAKAAFVITECSLSFGLFHVDGTYDYNRDFVSSDKKAIEWGEELFECYRKQAERVLSL